MLPIGKTTKKGKRVILPPPSPAQPRSPVGPVPLRCPAWGYRRALGEPAALRTRPRPGRPPSPSPPAAARALPRRDRAGGERQPRAGAAGSGGIPAAARGAGPGRARPPLPPPPRGPARRLSWGAAAKRAQPADRAC